MIYHSRLPDAKHLKKTYISIYSEIFPVYFLVGGIATPLKNMSSSVGMIIPN